MIMYADQPGSQSQPQPQPLSTSSSSRDGHDDPHNAQHTTAATAAPTPPLTLSPAEPNITLVVTPPTSTNEYGPGPGPGPDIQQLLTQGSAAAPPPAFPPPVLPTLLDSVAAPASPAPDPNATDDSASQDDDADNDDDEDDAQDSTASASTSAAASAIPALALTYVFPTTATTSLASALSKSATAAHQDAPQPTVIDVRAVIKAAHGGMLPMEFAMRRYGGAGDHSSDEDDEDDQSASGGSDDDDDDDDDDQDASESGSGSDADNEGAGDDAEHDDAHRMDVDSPTPGPGFLSALNECQETKRRKLDEAAAASAARAKKRAAAAARRAAKMRKRHDWYDTQDPFIDDEAVFAGNLDLMVPVKQGFFVAVGPVAVIPKKGVSEVRGGASQGPPPMSSKPSAGKLSSAAGGGKGDPLPKSSRGTGNNGNNKGKDNANGPASNKSSASANPRPPPPASKSSASSASAAAFAASAAAAAGTTVPSSARLKYLKLPAQHADRAKGDLPTVLAACPDLISATIRDRLLAFKPVADAADWSNKKIFPEHLKEPFWEIVRDHLKETRNVPNEAFIWAVAGLYDYNLFTIRKYVATKHVPRFVAEVLDVEIEAMVDDLRELAREVPDMIVREEEKERARLAAKAAKASAADEGGAADDKPAATKPRGRKVRLSPEIKAGLSAIVRAVVLKAMFGLWKALAATKPKVHEWRDLLDRIELVRSVMDLVKDLFPAGFLLSRDVSLLPVWEQWVMTDEPGGVETEPTGTSSGASVPLPPPSAAAGSASKVSAPKRPRVDSTKTSKSSASAVAGAQPAPPSPAYTPIILSGDTSPATAAAITLPRTAATAAATAAATGAASPGGLSTAPSSPSDVEIVGIRTAATTTTPTTTAPAPPPRFTMPPLPDPPHVAPTSAKRKRSLTNRSGASSTQSTPTPTPTSATTPSGRRLSVDATMGAADDAPGSSKRARRDMDAPLSTSTAKTSTTPAHAPPSVPRIVLPAAPLLGGSGSGQRTVLGASIRARDAGVSPLRLAGTGGAAGWAAGASGAVGVRGGSVVQGLLAAGGIVGGEEDGKKGEGGQEGEGMVLD